MVAMQLINAERKRGSTMKQITSKILICIIALAVGMTNINMVGIASEKVDAFNASITTSSILKEVKHADRAYTQISYGNYWQEDTNGDGKADKSDAKTPIEWRVLWSNGSQAMLMAERCLDAGTFHGIDEDVTWESCDLRKWLNNSFINDAFTEEEQKSIISKVVVTENEVFTEWGEITGDINTVITTDKIFLPSEEDLTNTAFGFDCDYTAEDSARWATNTAYCASKADRYAIGECDTYWVRNSGQGGNKARAVYVNGSIGYQSTVNYIGHGIRPVLYLDLTGENTGSNEAPSTGNTTSKPLEPTQTPSYSILEDFDLFIGYTNKEWTETFFHDSTHYLKITGDGYYTVSFTATSAAEDILVLTLDTRLTSVPESLLITPEVLTVGNRSYSLGGCDRALDENGEFRMDIRNPYDTVFATNQALGDKVIPVYAGDMVSIGFNVAGMGKKNPSATKPEEGKKPGETAIPTATPTPTVAPTIKPNGTGDTGSSGNIVGTENRNSTENQSQSTKPGTSKKKKVKKPGKVTGVKIRAGMKTMYVSWNDRSTVSGYQIQYAMNKKFKNKKMKTAPGYDWGINIRNLKKGKIYYVRVRAYNKKSGKKLYGKWSKIKKVKILSVASCYGCPD